MSIEAAHILIIDDEKNYLLVLETLLADNGYKVTALNDPEIALTFLEESEVDVVITDMKMPKLSGKDVLNHIKRDYPYIPVLIMTAFGTIESAVDIMKMGASDYITKPFANDELLLSVHNAVELSNAHRQYKLLQENMETKFGKHQIIGKSKAIKTVLSLVDRAAPTKSNVLITGESGTGKELVAKAVHFSSPRKNGPFISVNCMALNSSLLESELFGHEKGSFTGAVAMRRGRFELADKGTLFLDEIGEISHDIQVKLLRVLQEKRFERVGGSEEIEVDIRIVAATNKNLQEEVDKGNFREDLFYRLNVVHIEIPPLRERREDVPMLLAHFMNSICQENNMEVKSISPDALEYLTGYDWPGNIRQLENVLERCIIMVPGNTINISDLPDKVKNEETQLKNALDLLPIELNLAETLDKLEAAIVRRSLIKNDFVQVKAAEQLGISKSLLQYKLRKYGITGH